MKDIVKINIKPKILSKSEVKIVGMSCTTNMEEKDVIIPNMVKEFYDQHIHKVKNRVNAPRSYGIYIDPPDWKPDQDEFTWIAGVEVSDFDNIPEGMIQHIIPARQYATLSVNPKKDDFNPYPYLYRWIKDSAYKQIDHFGFEQYDAFEGVESPFELHFPIEE
ncbi:GyrI-like domain-containing protein [Pseudalkalibacillus berkeleyi]|uniref:GyrI-like domain-containing protein n=1 Tax=Pseudalkalibacillus berkeleyi TaxID=1069813 RepID=A0ABS9H6J3_9BACL|nr:GyrI-like domain-containing protein [Pseudalkalibacillus berkeleyi]MCF6139415.1 GyrI-like domain-containing protein [Pseudalkalibacillus berkeleyi]